MNSGRNGQIAICGRLKCAKQTAKQTNQSDRFCQLIGWEASTECVQLRDVPVDRAYWKCVESLQLQVRCCWCWTSEIDWNAQD